MWGALHPARWAGLCKRLGPWPGRQRSKPPMHSLFSPCSRLFSTPAPMVLRAAARPFAPNGFKGGRLRFQGQSPVHLHSPVRRAGCTSQNNIVGPTARQFATLLPSRWESWRELKLMRTERGSSVRHVDPQMAGPLALSECGVPSTMGWVRLGPPGVEFVAESLD